MFEPVECGFWVVERTIAADKTTGGGMVSFQAAVNGRETMPVLQAAHIRPFSERGPDKPQNGLLLRADVHILFDKGYITVTPDLRVEVSKKIKEEYENGRDYYKYHGERLMNFPGSELIRPSKEFLEWHNIHKYEERNGRWVVRPSRIRQSMIWRIGVA